MINMAFNRNAHTRLVIWYANHGHNDTKTAPAAVWELFLLFAEYLNSFGNKLSRAFSMAVKVFSKTLIA